jgi:hypothetical protein
VNVPHISLSFTKSQFTLATILRETHIKLLKRFRLVKWGNLITSVKSAYHTLTADGSNIVLIKEKQRVKGASALVPVGALQFALHVLHLDQQFSELLIKN